MPKLTLIIWKKPVYGSAKQSKAISVSGCCVAFTTTKPSVSLWDSFESIQAFAGPDYEKAVYYPEDRKFLLRLEPGVTHYEVLMSAP